MSKNFYIMQRGWMDNDAFSDEPFTEREAFQYLIENAAWKPRNYRVGAKVYKLQRGQLTASLRYLAEAWQWNKNKVDRFLDILRISDMIGTDNGTGQTVITICNYSKYQDIGDKSGTDMGQSWDDVGTTLGQPWDKTNQDNQDNQDNHVLGVLELDTLYLSWINTYPVRGNDKIARQEFEKALSRIQIDSLMEKTRQFAESVADQDSIYITLPENWLHKDGWNAALRKPKEKPFDIDAAFDDYHKRTATQ